MLTRTIGEGRKSGNEPLRKRGLGLVSFPHLTPPLSSAGPSLTAEMDHRVPRLVQTSYPRPIKMGCTPGGFSHSRTLALSLSSLLSPRAFEDRSLGKPLENPDFGVMLDSDTMMIFPAI